MQGRDPSRRTTPREVHWAGVEVGSPCASESVWGPERVTTRAEQSGGCSWQTEAGEGRRREHLGMNSSGGSGRHFCDSNPTLPPPSHVSPCDLVLLAAWKEASGESCPCSLASGPWARWEKAESQQPRVTESRLPRAAGAVVPRCPPSSSSPHLRGAVGHTGWLTSRGLSVQPWLSQLQIHQFTEVPQGRRWGF